MIKDTNIATINDHNAITAHKLGDTELIGQIVHTQSDLEANKKIIISERSIKIRVRLVTHIEIQHNR